MITRILTALFICALLRTFIVVTVYQAALQVQPIPAPTATPVPTPTPPPPPFPHPITR